MAGWFLGVRSLFWMAAALAAALLVLVALVWILTPVHTTSIGTEVQVSDYVGFKLDTDKLYFGTVSPGNGATRRATLDIPDDSFVMVRVEGEMASWVTPIPSEALVSGGPQDIFFRLETPGGVEPGNYSSTVRVTAYRPAARWFLG
ncbi:MAG: hypothetical protein ACLFO2_03730 [Candidatus Woesearchaeota archaeon]